MNLKNSLREHRFDLFLNKLTNFIMIDGKKTKACIIVFNTLVVLKKKIRKDLVDKNQNFWIINQTNFQDNYINSVMLRIILQAIENLTPNLEVRKVRVSGSTYLVPAVLAKKKQETLALKWLIEAAKKRQKNARFDFSTCLAEEILDASRKLGQARQKRDELHRLAQLNRAFIRYRWW
jgi:small subunit ribosomal protein S7